jgi:competence protein ComEC
MRRPFAVIGFTFIASLVAASYAGLSISAAMAAVCAASAIVVFFGLSFFKHRKTTAVALCAAAAAFGVFCLAECLWYNPVLALNGQKAEISGEIADTPDDSNGQYIYTINADKIVVDGKTSPVKTKIRVYSYSGLEAEPFDRITANVTLSVPQDKNDYGYNSRAYYKSKGVYLFANGDDFTVIKTQNKPPYYYAIKLRQYISGVIGKYVGGGQGALAAGILIGDTSQISSGVKDDFRTTGISHILAVSGTQTSLIMEYLMLLLCAAFRLPRRPAAAITAGAIVIFMAVTGFSPSVMRAGIMALVCLCAIMIKRDADVVNSLGLSALVLCAVNPYAATDVGLLLSLTATLGMATISKRLLSFAGEKTKNMPQGAKKFIKAPLGILCETLGASLLTYPVIVLIFGRISLISLIANMIEVSVSLFVTLLTAVAAIMSPAWFLVFLIKPVAILIRVCCAFMMWFAHALASLPFASISASYGFVDILVVFVAALFILYFVFKGKGASGGVCVSCACLAVAVGVFSYSVASHGVMTVAAVSNTGGAIVTSNGHAVVIDLPSTESYPEEAVESYLKARNINEIDAVILTSYDKKREQSLCQLESAMKVRRVYMPQNGFSATDTGIAEPEKVSLPSKLSAPYGVTITMLPDKAQESMLALVSCASSKAVVTGGGGLGDYSAYNPDALKADLLIFGGDLNENFSESVSPKNAAGGSKSSVQTVSELIAAGANYNTEACSYMTRGNGSYKLSY